MIIDDKTEVEDLEEAPPADGGEDEQSEAGAEGAADKGKDGKGAKGGDEHEPQPAHPRFKEVYGKMKALERENEEKQKDIDALRNHSRQITTRLEEIEKKKADRPAPVAPDPIAEPDAHKAWVASQDLERQKETDKKLAQNRIETLIEVEAGLHDDYDEVVKIAEREMEKNPDLKKQVFTAGNPARAGYKLGKKIQEEKAKLEKDEIDRKDRIKGAHVEGAGDNPPPAGTGDKVTDEERRVIKNLWPDLPYEAAKKKYLANRR
jgi:hypothetical protein